MFTEENLRRIYDAENREGLDLATRYFPELEPHKGFRTHIVPASRNAFVACALDLGCKDVKLLLNPPATAAAPAVSAAPTSPMVLRRRPKAASKA